MEVPYGYIQEKLGVLLSNERPMVLAALSFIKALMQRNPRDRLTADQLPNHVFFRVSFHLELAQNDKPAICRTVVGRWRDRRGPRQ